MMKAVGFTDQDVTRPLIGVAHSWIGTMPCNWNHRTLAEKLMQAIRAARRHPLEVNTISITNGIAMATEGMKSSLISPSPVTRSASTLRSGDLIWSGQRQR
jgi:dihydroxy-acid dehydratase